MRASPTRCSSGSRSTESIDVNFSLTFAIDCARVPSSALQGTMPLRCPAFRAHQRNEADIGKFLGRVFVLGYADDAHQFLHAPIGSHRNDQSTTDLELRL